MPEFTVKDSGVRQEFDTGSRRDTQEGKERYDLIGIQGLKRLAKHMAEGAKKYGERNWELGQPTSRSYASALRHLMQWALGFNDEDHLAAVAFNVFSIMHVEEGGNNNELRGKYGLMDHPRHNVGDTRTDELYNIVHSVVVDYQVTRSYYGGTTDELYNHFNEGKTADEYIMTRDMFADTLIELEHYNRLILQQDGVNTPVWQASNTGTPQAWEKVADINEPHAAYCRCADCEDEREIRNEPCDCGKGQYCPHLDSAR